MIREFENILTHVNSNVNWCGVSVNTSKLSDCKMDIYGGIATYSNLSSRYSTNVLTSLFTADRNSRKHKLS